MIGANRVQRDEDDVRPRKTSRPAGHRCGVDRLRRQKRDTGNQCAGRHRRDRGDPRRQPSQDPSAEQHEHDGRTRGQRLESDAPVGEEVDDQIPRQEQQQRQRNSADAPADHLDTHRERKRQALRNKRIAVQPAIVREIGRQILEDEIRSEHCNHGQTHRHINEPAAAQQQREQKLKQRAEDRVRQQQRDHRNTVRRLVNV